MLECTFENGNTANLRHACANAIVLSDDRSSILLARRSPNLVGGGLWCLPGGYMELHSRAKETAKKEIEEETGYDAEITGLVCVVDGKERNDNDRHNVVFVFAAVAKNKVGTPDEETSELCWFALDSLPEKSEWAFDHRGIVDKFVKNGMVTSPTDAVFFEDQ